MRRYLPLSVVKTVTSCPILTSSLERLLTSLTTPPKCQAGA